MPPRGAHHTCRGAHVCLLELRRVSLARQGHGMVPPWCSQGFSWWLPSLSHLLLPPLLLKEQYGSFSLFLKETSICLRRHNGIINNYKLKFQKSLSLHLHHLSQVRARCPFGAHAVHVWLSHSARAMCVWPALGARLARPWYARGANLARPRCSSHSPWSLNHQTYRISLLSS